MTSSRTGATATPGADRVVKALTTGKIDPGWLDAGDVIDLLSTETIIAAALRLTAGAASTTDGVVWNDSTQKSLQAFVAGIEQTLAGVIFTSTATATVANTVTETSLIGSGVGTLTLPVNFFTVGKMLRLRVRGILTDTGTPTIRVRFKLGSTTIVETTAVALAGTISNNAFCATIDLVCRTTGATGTVIAAGEFIYDESTHAGTRLGMAATATTTIDTTATQAVDLTVEWGTANASNTISGQTCTLEILN